MDGLLGGLSAMMVLLLKQVHLQKDVADAEAGPLAKNSSRF